jgi:hypothetical protein
MRTFRARPIAVMALVVLITSAVSTAPVRADTPTDLQQQMLDLREQMFALRAQMHELMWQAMGQGGLGYGMMGPGMMGPGGYGMMGPGMMGQGGYGMMGPGFGYGGMGPGMMGYGGVGPDDMPGYGMMGQGGYGMMGGVGADADRNFVLMIQRHHQGEIAMATAIAAETKDPEIKKLAETIRADHEKDLQALQEWLEKHP